MNMELYVQVSFYMGVVAIAAGLVLMATGGKYPRKQKDKELGADVARLILQIAFLAWAGSLLF